MNRRIDHVVTFDATPRLLEAFGTGPRIISLLGEIMSQLTDLSTETKAAIADMKARIAADFDNLRAAIEAGTITQAELDEFRANVIGEIKAVDPDPNFPVVEVPAEPPVDQPTI